MKRVEVSWHPDQSTVYINRARDRKLAVTALVSAAESGDEGVQDLIRRRFPRLAINEPIEEFAIDRSESPLLVRALTNMDHELEKGFLMRRRAVSLIGEVVLAAPVDFLPEAKIAK